MIWAVLSGEGRRRLGYGGPWRLRRTIELAWAIALSFGLLSGFSAPSQAAEENLSYIVIDAETETVLD